MSSPLTGCLNQFGQKVNDVIWFPSTASPTLCPSMASPPGEIRGFVAPPLTVQLLVDNRPSGVYSQLWELLCQLPFCLVVSSWIMMILSCWPKCHYLKSRKEPDMFYAWQIISILRRCKTNKCNKVLDNPSLLSDKCKGYRTSGLVSLDNPTKRGIRPGNSLFRTPSLLIIIRVTLTLKFSYYTSASEIWEMLVTQ